MTCDSHRGLGSSEPARSRKGAGERIVGRKDKGELVIQCAAWASVAQPLHGFTLPTRMAAPSGQSHSVKTLVTSRCVFRSRALK